MQVWEGYEASANGDAGAGASEGATEPESVSVVVTDVSEAGLFHVQVLPYRCMCLGFRF